MKVKELLNKYNGEFYIYENVYNEHGYLIDNDCIADHNTPFNYLDKVRNREIHDFSAGNFFLCIYLKDY